MQCDKYYELRHYKSSVEVITKCNGYYKVWLKIIAKRGSTTKFYRKLLLSVTNFTKCDNNFKMRRITDDQELAKTFNDSFENALND